MENFDTVLRLIPLALCIVQGLFAWVVWSLRKRFVTAEDCATCRNKTENKVGKIESRLAETESALRDMPSKAEFHELALTMKELQGDLKAMRASVETLNTMTNRQEEFLLNGATR